MAAPAAAQSTASSAVAPAVETVDADSQLGGGGFIIPLLALAAIIAGILVLLDDDDEEPVSP